MKSIYLILAVIGLLVLAGCGAKEVNEPVVPVKPVEPADKSVQPVDKPTDRPLPPVLKTCAVLKGDVCNVGDDCPGEWLDAADTFSCCSKTCEGPEGSQDMIEIQGFDIGPEDEELGDLV